MNTNNNAVLLSLTSAQINGKEVFSIELSKNFILECNAFDEKWNAEFHRFISRDYPYTMSPETSLLIAQAWDELEKQMEMKGFHIKSWEKGDIKTEPYVMSVLRRVCIPDTIEPIFDNTDKMAGHLMQLARENPSRLLKIRSFFTGAAVAEKCLLARSHALGLKRINMISTDNSSESIAIAAINLQLWNQSLDKKDQYEILIIKGSIPDELYLKEQTIVLQIADALEASKEEIQIKPGFDALLLDNGLPYVSKEYGGELVQNVCKCMGVDGLFLAALGLDAKIKVEIDTKYHISNILAGCFTDVRKDSRIGKFHAPYNYPHYYDFVIQETGNILISKVLSDGAARIYNWLAFLLRTNLPKFIKLMKTIKSVTELSRVRDAVITTPYATHISLLQMLESNGFVFSEIERPLEYEKFGWEKIGSDKYKNDGRVVNGEQLMEQCRQIDPLVLRKSILHISQT